MRCHLHLLDDILVRSDREGVLTENREMARTVMCETLVGMIEDGIVQSVELE